MKTKSVLLPLALIPLLLTGCATGGYVGYDSPGYYPEYSDGPYYAPSLDVAIVERGYYGHPYHHYDGGYHHSSTYTAYSSSRVSGGHYASVSSHSHSSGGGRGAAVSMGSHHHHDGF